jgi:hypothetical protein
LIENIWFYNFFRRAHHLLYKWRAKPVGRTQEPDQDRGVVLLAPISDGTKNQQEEPAPITKKSHRSTLDRTLIEKLNNI